MIRSMTALLMRHPLLVLILSVMSSVSLATAMLTGLISHHSEPLKLPIPLFLAIAAWAFVESRRQRRHAS